MQITAVELTPNPNARKFVLDEPVLVGGSRQYESAASASADALASAVFKLAGVSSVFFMDNFVTVDRASGDWDEVRTALEAALAAGLRPSTEAASAPAPAASVGGNEELLERINAVLDEMVRPALAGDGGGLRVAGLRGHDLYIHYQGACGSCPSATAGTMYAIQNLLRAEVDERLTVIAT